MTMGLFRDISTLIKINREASALYNDVSGAKQKALNNEYYSETRQFLKKVGKLLLVIASAAAIIAATKYIKDASKYNEIMLKSFKQLKKVIEERKKLSRMKRIYSATNNNSNPQDVVVNSICSKINNLGLLIGSKPVKVVKTKTSPIKLAQKAAKKERIKKLLERPSVLKAAEFAKNSKFNKRHNHISAQNVSENIVKLKPTRSGRSKQVSGLKSFKLQPPKV